MRRLSRAGANTAMNWRNTLDGLWIEEYLTDDGSSLDRRGAPVATQREGDPVSPSKRKICQARLRRDNIIRMVVLEDSPKLQTGIQIRLEQESYWWTVEWLGSPQCRVSQWTSCDEPVEYVS